MNHLDVPVDVRSCKSNYDLMYGVSLAHFAVAVLSQNLVSSLSSRFLFVLLPCQIAAWKQQLHGAYISGMFERTNVPREKFMITPS